MKTGIWQINFGAMRLIAQYPFVNPSRNGRARALRTWPGVPRWQPAHRPWRSSLHPCSPWPHGREGRDHVSRLPRARLWCRVLSPSCLVGHRYFWVSNDSLTLFLRPAPSSNLGPVAPARPGAGHAAFRAGSRLRLLLLALLIAGGSASGDPDLIGLVLVVLAGSVTGKCARALFAVLCVEFNWVAFTGCRKHLPLLSQASAYPPDPVLGPCLAGCWW